MAGKSVDGSPLYRVRSCRRVALPSRGPRRASSSPAGRAAGGLRSSSVCSNIFNQVAYTPSVPMASGRSDASGQAIAAAASNMASPSVLLTCDGAFDMFGLSFEDDSVFWGVLVNGYLEIDKSLCHPVMKAEPYLRRLAAVDFSPDASDEVAWLSRLCALGHYATAYYLRHRKKKNTLVGYLRLLCKIANSIFSQLVIMRYMGTCQRNENLKAVFDTLKNPVDEEDGPSCYESDDLYEFYRSRLPFYSRVLCNCEECVALGPSALLRRVQPCAHLRDCPTFYPMYPPPIGHLSPLQIQTVLVELSEDVMQRYVYQAIDGGYLPLKQTVEEMGKGFLEKAVLFLLCNVTFVLFLMSVVRRLLYFELQLFRQHFHRWFWERSWPASPLASLYEEFRASVHADEPLERVPMLLHTFLTRVRGETLAPLGPAAGTNRAKVVLDHLCLLGASTVSRPAPGVRLAQQLRHMILAEYEVVNFTELAAGPDSTVLNRTVLYAVSGQLMLRAPLWFTGCLTSGMVSEMVAAAALRQRSFVVSEARALRKRIAKRLLPWQA
ncbi:T30 [Tupaiid betaherpesvirus 1]|uniref:T30 n=1 Tax=Tupaiid herpesvirus 1 (strain 1) TaxID=10397 RepID=Q91TR3_TUHV1|nr:T30 [Tupaiid betaherpesvirus 1]AAK57074.1 T30 [Tupaiid betaherpesvirus 1]